MAVTTELPPPTRTTGTPGTAERATTARRAAGEAFLTAVATRDFGRLEACFHPEVRFRALAPSRLYEAAGAAAATGYLRRWFGDADAFEVQKAEVDELADRLRLGYRLRLHDKDGWQVIEQHAFCDVRAGRIAALDLLCSGFRPEAAGPGTSDGATGALEGAASTTAVPTAPSAGTTAPHADARLDALGEGCATLTPLIRAHVRALASGQVLEVRCDDPAAHDGIPAWCRLTGNELLDAVDEPDSAAGGGRRTRFYIRKK
jgi:TusA-related sulfurtransferase